MKRQRPFAATVLCSLMFVAIGCAGPGPYVPRDAHTLRGLAPGESTTVTICAQTFWNGTGFRLDAVQPYRLTVAGCQHWWDFFVRTGACGYRSFFLKPFECQRRVPTADWFTLIGTIDGREDATFRIGRSLTYTPTITGELVCFANDVSWQYWNNFGRLVLTVAREPATPPPPP